MFSVNKSAGIKKFDTIVDLRLEMVSFFKMIECIKTENVHIAPLFSNNNLECQKYCLLMQPSKCMVLSLAHIQMMRACIQMIVCI